MKKHNFSAGPSILPQAAIEATIEALRDFRGTGLSVCEISHRTKEWESVMEECRALWVELLNIPAGYQVLFLSGGASMQFMQVPYNLLNKKAAYLDTGVWASKAIKEAKLFGEVEVVASGKDVNYTAIPQGYSIPKDADYLHITTNNTIYGTELHQDLDSPVLMVADMSSDIMTRPVDVSKYAIIYGGAQKNTGPAGVAFAIVREDALGKTTRPLPSMMDYRNQIKEGSMYNTPPVLPIYMMYETLKWLKSIGGIAEVQKRNTAKAELLYSAIDKSKMFRGTVDKKDRSVMNVCFVMQDQYADKEKLFLEFSKQYGIDGIKGHRLVGGFRASIYNALPIESIQALVNAIQDFEKANV